MRKFIFLQNADAFYAGDIHRIVRVLVEHEIDVSYTDAELAWSSYSDSMAAGWLYLPDYDFELYKTVMAELVEAKPDE